jgi:hypothetical protein
MNLRLPRRGVLAAVVALASALPLVLGGVSGPAVGTARDEPAVLGEEERVEVLSPSGEESVRALAKVDTGATYTSVDDDLARELGLDLANARVVVVSSALGQEYRPLVEVRLRVEGRTLSSEATVSEREGLDNPVLIGRRDLPGFLIRVQEEGTPEEDDAGSRPGALMLLSALPLAALPVFLLRALAGLPLLGLATPVLLALAALSVLSGGGTRAENTPAVALLLVAVALLLERFVLAARTGDTAHALEAVCWTLLAALAVGSLLAAEPVLRLAEASPLPTAAGGLLACLILLALGPRSPEPGSAKETGNT